MPAQGAYGFRLEGFDHETGLTDVPDSWPTLCVRHRDGKPPVNADVGDIGLDRAALWLLGDVLLTLDREPLTATYWAPTTLDAESLLHPYLAPAAAIASWWLGRETFHGGGLALEENVWGVIGEKGSGKSTLLAWLAHQGHDIFSDDAIVLEGARAFVGPRSIDLREAPSSLALGAESLGLVGDRARWRVQLPPAPPTLALRGWIFLEWASTVEVTPLAPEGVFERLATQRMVLLRPPDPPRLLDYATLPAFVFRRPRRWEEIGSSVDHLIAAIA